MSNKHSNKKQIKSSIDSINRVGEEHLKKRRSKTNDNKRREYLEIEPGNSATP